MTSLTTSEHESDPMCERELSIGIDEEIGRLPEKYRAPIVLCYLEGLTHEMAADRLGWPVGSVKSRLAWARERLRMRLTLRGFAPAGLPVEQFGSSPDKKSLPGPPLPAAHLVDATLRGVLKTRGGSSALAGVVSSETVELMEVIIKSMATTKLMLMTSGVLAAGMAIIGAGVMGYSITRDEAASLASHPGQEVHQPVPDPRLAQAPPRPAAAKAVTDHGPVAIQVQIADPQGRRLAGADVCMTIWYAGHSAHLEPVVEQARTDGTGTVQFEAARERPGATLHSASVWAYQSGRAFAATNVSFARNASLVTVPLTLEQPTKWTITVLDPDERPLADLRLTPPHVSGAPMAAIPRLFPRRCSSR